ncbi:hypothetical protein K456DRAFT_1058744 [Colletotrichum gloeosporioides 23]|nr:hypothetical protein K456DRAFT_1058744 [Colletotrichum gloeosporioides 23]
MSVFSQEQQLHTPLACFPPHLSIGLSGLNLGSATVSGIEAPAGRGASALQLDLRSPPPRYVCTAPSPSIVPCQQHPRQCVTGAASLHIHQSHSLFSQQASCSRAEAPNARQDETGRPILLPHVRRLPVQCLSALLASLGVRLLHHYNLVHYIPASVPRSLSLRALLGATSLSRAGKTTTAVPSQLRQNQCRPMSGKVPLA